MSHHRQVSTSAVILFERYRVNTQTHTPQTDCITSTTKWSANVVDIHEKAGTGTARLKGYWLQYGAADSRWSSVRCAAMQCRQVPRVVDETLARHARCLVEELTSREVIRRHIVAWAASPARESTPMTFILLVLIVVVVVVVVIVVVL